MKIFFRIIALSLISLVAGCSSHKQSDYKSYNSTSLRWQDVAPEELSFYKDTKQISDGKPRIGVALSGGGQRAASVSIGFLNALDEKGILENVDAISSVSGGSYASYWWYTKKYWAEKAGELEKANKLLFKRYYVSSLCGKDKINTQDTVENIAKHVENECVEGIVSEEKLSSLYDEYRFFYHNRSRAILLTKSQYYRAARYPELAGKITSAAVSLPFHWLANGLFDQKRNWNVFEGYYQNGLERDYGLYPACSASECIRLKSYENDKWARFKAHDPSMPELYRSIKSQNLPFWIINTTAAYSQSSWPKMVRANPSAGYSLDLANTVYEFTPAGQGSPRFGYCSEGNENCFSDENIELSRMIAISGAAVDSLSLTLNATIDVLNLSLGQYIENPNIRNSTRTAHRLLPIPFAWMHQNHHHERSPFIYLSDGGHSDNLGIYSLIRRGTKQIIVLDSEQESEKNGRTLAAFESLRLGRCSLLRERGILIDIPGLITGKADCDAGRTIADIKRSTLDFDFQKASQSTLAGTICQVEPEQADCSESKTLATLTYVKLSADYSQLGANEEAYKQCVKGEIGESGIYSCDTRIYANNNRRLFPHDPTADISYSASQYSGYVGIGYDLGRQLRFQDGVVGVDSLGSKDGTVEITIR